MADEQEFSNKLGRLVLGLLRNGLYVKMDRRDGKLSGELFDLHATMIKNNKAFTCSETITEPGLLSHDPDMLVDYMVGDVKKQMQEQRR